MNSAVIIVLLIGAVSAFELSAYDPLACVDASQPPITRVVDANLPVAVATPGFNFSDPDSTYPPNTICQWSFFTDPGNELQASFFNFSIEDTASCVEEYVQVYDSADDTGTQLSNICGDLGTVSAVAATGTEMFIRFNSDDDATQGVGFMSRVGYPVEVTACDNPPQTFTAPAGLFGSENYPVNYRNNIQCDYLFQAPAGQVIEVGFYNTDIEECCGCDQIQAFAGANQVAPKLSHWYGSGKACALRTSGNELFLRFATDFSVTGTGFLGFYQFI